MDMTMTPDTTGEHCIAAARKACDALDSLFAGIAEDILARGTAVKPVLVGGDTVGCCFDSGPIEYCRIGGIVSNPEHPRERQAREAFETMESALQSIGMSFSDVLRTWFFLEGITSWYTDFNRVRDEFFAERGLFDGLLPAGTGVGVRNAGGPSVISGLLAARPRDGRPCAYAVPSPLQGPATDYGSSFSRAVEIAAPGERRLLVSGTASIWPDGRTAHPGDIDSQIALTSDVVEVILESRGAGWADVTRAIAYIKHIEHAPAYQRFLDARGSASLPAVVIEADICRDDLLFEIELDAVVRDRSRS